MAFYQGSFSPEGTAAARNAGIERQQGGGGVQPFRAGVGLGGIYNTFSASNQWAAPGNYQWLIDKQLNEMNTTNTQNRADWGESLNFLKGVMPNYRANPLIQGANAQAQALVNNPEAINDQTQQRIINRMANLVNAGANARGADIRGNLAAQGQLGGSSEQAAMDKLGRERGAQLQSGSLELEVQRANQRNADIIRAAGLAGGLGQQETGNEMGVANTWMQNLPLKQPDDLSFLAAMFGGGGASGGFGAAPGQNWKSNTTRSGSGNYGGSWMSGGWGNPIPGQPGMGSQTIEQVLAQIRAALQARGQSGGGNTSGGGTDYSSGWEDYFGV